MKGNINKVSESGLCNFDLLRVFKLTFSVFFPFNYDNKGNWAFDNKHEMV